METKTCIKCGAIRPVDEFPLHHDEGKVTRRNVCKLCENARKRAIRRAERAILDSRILVPDTVAPDGDPAHFQPEISDLVTVYLNLIHWKPEALRSVSLEKYNKHFNLDVSEEEFKEIENRAEELLKEFGYFNPQFEWFDTKGRYLVIGDTFGTHTPECVFQLINQIVKRENITAVIVVGHNLDDENLVSNLIASSGVPTTIVAMKNELKALHAQRGYGYEIVQDHVRIGNLIIRNQEHITPYVKTALGSLDPMLFPGQMIVNCTRQELSVRPTPKGLASHFVASPGALADPHVVTTINRLILNSGEGLSVRPTLKDSYLKHRKNEIDKHLWERGFIIVNNGNVLQRRIHVNSGVFEGVSTIHAAAVSNDVVVDNFGTEYKTKQTLVLSDLHIPRDAMNGWLGVILKEFKPHEIILNGDIFDCRSFNPHSDYEASHADLDQELTDADSALDLMFGERESAMSRQIHMPYLDNITDKAQIKFLWGNHEDFIRRFTRQYPQFEKHFNKQFTKLLQTYGHVQSMDDTEWYETENHTVIHHGSADIFGIGGNNLEKTARTFQRPAIIGHTHSPAIRFGVYRTGCLCKLDQGYNNAQMSNWARGFAVIYSANGVDFIELRNWL